MVLQVLAIYNHRLDERERRKAFILEQGLLVRKHDENKKKWGREEKELHRKIGTFPTPTLIPFVVRAILGSSLAALFYK